MQRDMKLVKRILEDIVHAYRGLSVAEISPSREDTMHKIQGHWDLLVASELIASPFEKDYFVLTWEGHNLLDSLRGRKTLIHGIEKELSNAKRRRGSTQNT